MVVTFIVGGVFLMGLSVESLNTSFGKAVGFLFLFSLASLTVGGCYFVSDCFFVWWLFVPSRVRQTFLPV